MFLGTRGAYNINVRRDLRFGNAFDGFGMNASISFLESLVEIPGRLKRLPRHLRKRGLDMQIRLLNHNLPAKVSLPFRPTRFVLAARVEESLLLDSAENSPFLIVFETGNRAVERSCEGKEFKNVQLLKQHLDAEGGSLLNETGITKGNVTDSMKRTLMTKRCGDGWRHPEKCVDDKEASTCKDEERGDVQYLDDIHINRRISKQSRDHRMFLMNNRSYSAEQLRQEHADRYLEGVEAKDNVERALENTNSSIGYRRHDSWVLKKAELRRTSLFGEVEGWSAESVIVKTGDSMRQELVAYQVLSEMRRIWREEKKPIWVYAYQIYLVSDTAGIVETVVDAMSIHKIKKKMQSENKNYSLKSHFVESFGLNSERYKNNIRNFLYSLVGYSLATYILQVKDRHNGNIMIDNQGHVVHVDFGFIMGTHPGFYCVEGAPFKFSKEYLDLLEDLIDEFKDLFYRGYIALRRHSDRLFRIVEVISEDSGGGWFSRREVLNFKDRFKLELSEEKAEEYVAYLVGKSLDSMGTGLYDSYQYFSYGYL